MQARVAGRVLEQLHDNPGVSEVLVDGVPVRDKDAAIAVYERSQAAPKLDVFGPLDRLASKVAGKHGSHLDEEERRFREALRPGARLKARLSRAAAKVGSAVRFERISAAFAKVSAIDAQPVRYTAQVEIRMRDGTSATVPEEYVDTRSTLTMKRLALLSETTALNPVPFMGPIVPALLGATELTAAAVVGSLAGLSKLGLVPKSQTSGTPVAAALLRAGAKQLAVAGVSMLPGLSELTLPLTIYADARDVARLKASL